MKFNFIHLLFAFNVFCLVVSKKAFHHNKHRLHHKHHNKRGRLFNYDFYNFDFDNNVVAFHDGGHQQYELIEPMPYRDTEIENIDVEHHRIRHQPEQVTVEPIPWPVKKEAVMEGDIVLGGLMMVHEREDTVTCGPVMPQGGIQALEAMLYTLDKLNENSSFTIGAHILDDCDKDTYGLEMAVDFIKGKDTILLYLLTFRN